MGSKEKEPYGKHFLILNNNRWSMVLKWEQLSKYKLHFFGEMCPLTPKGKYRAIYVCLQSGLSHRLKFLEIQRHWQ